MRYIVPVTVTVSGYVTIEADSKADAEVKATELTLEIIDINDPDYSSEVYVNEINELDDGESEK